MSGALSAGEIRRHVVVQLGGVLHQQVNIRQIGERGELGWLWLLLRRLGRLGGFRRRFRARGARREKLVVEIELVIRDGRLGSNRRWAVGLPCATSIQYCE